MVRPRLRPGSRPWLLQLRRPATSELPWGAAADSPPDLISLSQMTENWPGCHCTREGWLAPAKSTGNSWWRALCNIYQSKLANI